jgi:hypothetical protein
MQLALYHLASPIDSFSDPVVKEFYIKAIECKLKGFSSVYGDVNPIDATEILCDHFMFCVPTTRGLEVISTFKVIKNSQIERFNMTPPCVSLINTIQCEDTRESLLNSINDYYKEKESCYMYSWTISKEYRNTEMALEIRKRTLSVLRHYVLDNGNCGATIVGMSKVKTDLMLQSIGFEPFVDNEGKQIMHFKSPMYDNCDALLLKLNSWNEKFILESNKDKEFYDNRLIVGATKSSGLKKVA